MILSLEFKKIRRTGYLPAFFWGGLLSAAVPAVNMAVRAELFTGLPGSPFHILMDANWQLMSQLVIFLIVCGCSLMYAAEYTDRGDLRMSTLPVRPSSLFLGKLAVAALSLVWVLSVQTLSLTLCCKHWFPDRGIRIADILKEAAFELALFLPTLTLMLAAASACRNLWISLGSGIILTFLGSMLPSDPLLLSLLPFCAPYRMLHGIAGTDALFCLAVCGAETLLFYIAGLIYLQIRRSFL